ncbi:cysteine--1-D-myo-inosityl 2-amino-2-deoxy-alpha-D-glucopyranoside ligase [Galbitalea sp. SE-J8]|uniref:cysteine--1-D-myo-inosityl 2-amino-2-deoxy-alpha-D-glucopyranoside ligase n=1 Tax=Galbitalea sp. SE-J8 TaxID=3054952 RepID=UPI00259C8A75|nr:cysteine--1-D-myo-inosityl 2-amino-2-deoxy-alpha-D-glucopyranoside ligase [Galbitalea sp. SE-J8]MDM4763178.1 cysteine--1-D-myo-inosityl 2-amino-2-deoxy-alpha-D-glucopyranoside ligase [Galbitalea sp. SE-J8]
MRSWPAPRVPRLPGRGTLPRVHDTATGALVEVGTTDAASLYVCGITPYDATHLGHAATYLAFDTLHRLWLDAGATVTFVENTTDVDDPLLERAAATGEPWRELAARETQAFRDDMITLGILPPAHYVAVTEVVDEIAAAVASLLARGAAYRLGGDVYFDGASATSAPGSAGLWRLGDVSGLDRAEMLALSAERGGDPERPGKRDPLDPVLWRGARDGEPSWPSVIGAGRPGWHIECSVIARRAGLPLSVVGGGRDLTFPHHEYSAGHTAALDRVHYARAYVHAGLVSYAGQKMSKSLGNLVLVSPLVDAGHEPAAIRLALLAGHYRWDREWTDAVLATAERRLARWRATPLGVGDAGVTELRAILAEDLDTPGAIAFLDAAPWTRGLAEAVDALLGIRL